MPEGTPTGYIDGGWWPRSGDLVTELPALLNALTERLGPVATVSYALAGWEPAPRRINIRGRSVRLGGFRSLDEHVLDVIGPDGRRLALLVIPPGYSSSAGEQALALAASSNTDTPAQTLAAANINGREPLTAR